MTGLVRQFAHLPAGGKNAANKKWLLNGCSRQCFWLPWLQVGSLKTREQRTRACCGFPPALVRRWNACCDS